ncbi:hypothetical protein DEAC_c23860 [Desulfosporosinus acididurans]|uniref:DUF5714 domain-containing protein n=2 Tax=Desulfosporosinus acididurans TaxID=476652 RepID=A0A0J1IM24_9FIRM|nr:hypothetical protein DEAC_c23860 [Desulfosporosinus acididurans]
MAALKNEGTIGVTNEQIVEALNRAKRQAIGGYCGLTGVCGIVPAIGACFSVILGAACPKDQETAMTMKVAARIVDKIADETGPCCCKNFVRNALSEAVIFVKEYFNVSLPSPSKSMICTYSSRHPHGCRESKCSYFERNETPQNLKMEMSEKAILNLSLNKYDDLVRKAAELGIEEAKIIDTSTISVAEWAQWKCQYGCAFYDKGAFHPPLAPKAEETKRVLQEYEKAFLLTGPNGPELSRQAIKLEHAAYSLGYYKAFSLLALPFGGAPT